MTNQVILLIEDNQDDELLTLRGLKRNNIANEITVASDGAEAVDRLLRDGGDKGPLPGLIPLDLNLPKVGGLEVLRKIRAGKRTRFIPVVVLTSSRGQEDVFASYRCGANAYVRKPVSFSDFAEAIRTVGVFWLLHNEAPADIIPPTD